MAEATATANGRMNASGLRGTRVFKKTLITIFVAAIFFLGGTIANARWVTDERNRTDVRVYATMSRLHPEFAEQYPKFIVTRIWLDESGSIVFIDWDNDGIEDLAHVQQIKFWMDGKPALGDSKDVPPEEALDAIENYIRTHSAGTLINFETEGKHNV